MRPTYSFDHSTFTTILGGAVASPRKPELWQQGKVGPCIPIYWMHYCVVLYRTGGLAKTACSLWLLDAMIGNTSFDAPVTRDRIVRTIMSRSELYRTQMYSSRRHVVSILTP